jgi:DNA-directed RNA polymerase subunit RPC12/RpoP
MIDYDLVNVEYTCPNCSAELKNIPINDSMYNGMYKSSERKKYELGDQIYHGGRWIYVDKLKLSDICSGCRKEIKGELRIEKGVISKILLITDHENLEKIAEIDLKTITSNPHENRPWK